MHRFERLSAIAAPLPLANVDTDKILPARFLKTIRRDGLGAALFHAMRFDDNGQERPDFVLNRTPWREAQILIARDNFGCGSSREHAPWALADFGICCIVAPSFADIFFSNCFKNGILPIVLAPDHVEVLLAAAADPERARMSVDLPAQRLGWRQGVLGFEIAPVRKRALLLGLDEIAETLTQADALAAFEVRHRGRGLAIPVDIDRLGSPTRGDARDERP